MADYTSFLSLSASETAEMRDFLFTEKKIYNKGDIIMHSGKQGENLALLKKGSAVVIRSDADGHRNIIDYYETGEILGWIFYPIQTDDIMYITAKEKCIINFTDYNKILNSEKNMRFFNSMILDSVAKTQIHMDILSKRSIRNKLLSYFKYIKRKKNSDKFTLPLNISDLADYLAVDRSAMTREIKKLNEDGIIESSGNLIIMKDNEYGE